MKKPIRSLEAEFATFWVDCFIRGRGIRASAGTRRRLGEVARKLFTSRITPHDSSVALRRDSKGRLIAAVFGWSAPMLSRPSDSIRYFSVHTLPGDRSSLRWAKAILTHQWRIEPRCSLRLDPWQTSLLPWLEREGLKIRSVILEGEVSHSLRRLREHYGAALRRPLENAGLFIEPTSRRQDVEAYLRLVRSEYGRNPQFGYYVGTSAFIKILRKGILQGIRQKQNALWLVRRGRKLLGGVDIFEYPKEPDGKRKACFGVVLLPEAQGKYFARAMYERILMELERRGVDCHTGQTAQPGVMRLGKIMGRKLQAVEVDRGITKSFSHGHFRVWV